MPGQFWPKPRSKGQFMNYDEIFTSVIALIAEHNSNLPEKAQKINSAEFIDNIKIAGGTSVERLATMTHEDIIDCIVPERFRVANVPVPKIPVPRILAKAIAGIFRNKESKELVVKEEATPFVSVKKAEKMTLKELVEYFNPFDGQNAVYNQLVSRSKGEAFIVYNDDRTVNVGVTLLLLSEIQSGYNGRADINVDNVVKKVYKITEIPDVYVDENPLYRNRPLRPDGTCDQTGRSWQGVPTNIRQLVRLAMDHDGLNVDISTAHNVMDIVMNPNAFTILITRYRKAAIKFTELAGVGNLPKLKILLGGSEGKRPFAQGHKVDMESFTELSKAEIQKAKRAKRVAPIEQGELGRITGWTPTQYKDRFYYGSTFTINDQNPVWIVKNPNE